MPSKRTIAPAGASTGWPSYWGSASAGSGWTVSEVSPAALGAGRASSASNKGVVQRIRREGTESFMGKSGIRNDFKGFKQTARVRKKGRTWCNAPAWRVSPGPAIPKTMARSIRARDSLETEAGESEKGEIAGRILSGADLALSVQVLQEFYVRATHSRRPDALTHDSAVRLIEKWMRFRIQKRPFRHYAMRLKLSGGMERRFGMHPF